MVKILTQCVQGVGGIGRLLPGAVNWASLSSQDICAFTVSHKTQYTRIYIYNINYSHSVIRVHTMFMCVLVYYTSYFLHPTDSSQTCQFPPTGRQEHIQDVIESTTGPTSKWCKDVAKLLKCPLAQDGRVSQHLISPINGGLNGEIIYKW